MTLPIWWLFVLMAFVHLGTPGPNMLLVMSIGARSGLRMSVATMAGCMSVVLATMSLSTAGLGALLLTLPSLFNALRLAGAAYLAYLGLKSWFSLVHDQALSAPQQNEPAARPGALFRQGMLVAASNPKALLFFTAFFPQFINPQVAKLPQFAILLTTFALIEGSWFVVYAASGKRLSTYLQSASVMRAFNRLTGGVFIGFAAMMAFARD